MKIFASIQKLYQSFKCTAFGKAFVRTQYRSGMLLGMTILAGIAMEFLVQSARFGGTDLAAKFPELLQILRAVSILTWFEQAVLWTRLIVTPKIDVQALANKLQDSHNGCGGELGTTVVYVTQNVAWLVRIVLLYLLCGF